MKLKDSPGLEEVKREGVLNMKKLKTPELTWKPGAAVGEYQSILKPPNLMKHWKNVNFHKAVRNH